MFKTASGGFDECSKNKSFDKKANPPLAIMTFMGHPNNKRIYEFLVFLIFFTLFFTFCFIFITKILNKRIYEKFVNPPYQCFMIWVTHEGHDCPHH